MTQNKYTLKIINIPQITSVIKNNIILNFVKNVKFKRTLT